MTLSVQKRQRVFGGFRNWRSSFQKSKRARSVWGNLPVSTFMASSAAQLAMTPTAGPSTPALSQVSTSPPAGGSSMRQRRQGVCGGFRGQITPSPPMAPA